MIDALYASLRAALLEQGGQSHLRAFLEEQLEFAKTEANIETHLRLFKARTDPNYSLEDL